MARPSSTVIHVVRSNCSLGTVEYFSPLEMYSPLQSPMTYNCPAGPHGGNELPRTTCDSADAR